MDRIFQLLAVPVELAQKGEPLVVALLFCFIMGIGFWLGSGVRILKRKWNYLNHPKIKPIDSNELLK